jgi:hypothetical protein
MEADNKKLNIIAITDFSEYGDVAVRHGGILAAIFKASLTIITDFSFYPKTIKELKENSREPESHSDIWKDEIGSIQSATETPTAQISPIFNRTLTNLMENEIETFLLSEHFTAKSLYEYAEKTNTTMFVIGVSKKGENNFFNIQKAIKFIRSSRIPVMTVGNKIPEATVYQQVILPLDIDRQAKEKALWAGYFSRFYCATVHILHTQFKDEFLKQKLKDNIAFTEKLYNNLNITYELHQITPTVDNMDKYSLKFASQINASLTVIMMTRFYSLIDMLFGAKESAVIGNEAGFPVLCVNERDDLYVLCT